MPRSRPRTWLFSAAVALLPLLVLWRRADALYSPLWYSDPWFYLSGFLDLAEFKRGVFYNSYYASRLSWLLPGWAAHSLLPPMAGYTLLHLGVHLAATLALFSMVRRAIGARAGLLAAMVFSVNPWLWAATGWDYVDGAAVAWCLLAMAGMARAGATGERWPLVAAGAALAGMVYANIFWVALAPMTVLAGLGPRFRLARAVAWTAAGFAAATAALGAVNYALDGYFWFYGPSLAAARRFGTKFAEAGPVWDRGRLAGWLWPAAAGVATATLLAPWLLRARKTRRGPEVLACGQLLLAAAWMGWMQGHGSPVLSMSAYASALLPFAFLAMGMAYWPAVEKMSRAGYTALCAASAILLAALWSYPSTPWVAPLGVYAAAIAVLLAAALVLRRHAAGPVAAMAGFVVLTAAGSQHALVSGQHSTRAEFQAVLDTRARIEALRKGRTVRFWVSTRDPEYSSFVAINSLYGGDFRRIGAAFPAGCEAGVEPDVLAVVLSSDRDAVDKAMRALGECWAPMAMRPVLEAAERMGTPPFTVAFIRAEADRGRWTPLPTPLSGWAADAIQADPPRWQAIGDGADVRTPRGEFQHAARYTTLTAPFDGHFRLSLLVSRRRGQIAFGARDGDDAKWLAADTFGRPLGDRHEYSVWIRLRRGERFVPRIANNDLGGRGASSFHVHQADVIGVPAP